MQPQLEYLKDSVGGLVGDAVDATDTSVIVDTLQDISDRSVSRLWLQ